MSSSRIIGPVRRGVKQNSSLILSIGAGVGVLTTAYFTGKASFRAARVLDNEPTDLELKEKIKLVWQLYIPAGAAAATTVVCVVGVRHVDARKTLAAQTALAVSQTAYEGYRAQVVEELGERKDKLFLAKAKEQQIKSNPPGTIIAGSGTVLCCECFTGRYFNSDMQALSSAVNEVNSKLLRDDYATLDDFYYIIGLENTMISGQAGWKTPKLLELEFSSILHDGKPVLAFDYNYVTDL